MCTLFIAKKWHPGYKLIIAANRDEFYERPTHFAHWWADHPDILGGRDLKEGGSWFAINRNGRFATLTNYREIPGYKADAPSRGFLVKDFIESDIPAKDFQQFLKEKGEEYNGFNILFGTSDNLYYFSNRDKSPGKLKPGIYGLSNHLLDTPWPKLSEGKKEISDLLQGPNVPTSEKIFRFLNSKKMYPDEILPQTGVGIERERVLSSLFIESPGYGTRASWYLLIGNDGKVSLEERSYVPEGYHHFEFQIE